MQVSGKKSCILHLFSRFVNRFIYTGHFIDGQYQMFYLFCSSSGDATYSSIDAAIPVQREHYLGRDVADETVAHSNVVELEGRNTTATSYENIGMAT